MYGRIEIGANATIFPELANVAPVSARVILIDQVLDSASNTFRVTLKLPNPGYALPAGLRCRADFGLQPATATSSKSTPGAKTDLRPNADKPVPPAPSAGARRAGP